MRIILAICLGALALPNASFAAEGDGKHKEGKPHTEVGKEPHDAMPAGTKGVSEGVIVSKEKGKIILETKSGKELFMPHWKGGMPKDGGGLDKEMMGKLEGFKKGDHVRIQWVWQERRRIEVIEKTKE